MATEERIAELIDALAWLTEMAEYAADNLDPEWATKNRGDLLNAIEQANSALTRQL